MLNVAALKVVNNNTNRNVIQFVLISILAILFGIMLIIAPKLAKVESIGVPNMEIFVIFSVGTCSLVSGPIAKNLGNGPYTQATIEGILVFIVMLLVNGAEAGYRDRRLGYQYLARTSTMCKNYAVLRRFGDLYLTVAPSGARQMVDSDCNSKFTIVAKL